MIWQNRANAFSRANTHTHTYGAYIHGASQNASSNNCQYVRQRLAHTHTHPTDPTDTSDDKWIHCSRCSATACNRTHTDTGTRNNNNKKTHV